MCELVRRGLIAAAVVLGAWGAVLAGPGSSFTFQGRLTDGGAPVDGTADLRFRLYDAAMGGTQVGREIIASGVAVSGGLFTVELDFGAPPLSGQRWLEIDAASPSGSGAFETLSPRQKITSAPQAAQAIGATVEADGSVTLQRPIVRDLNIGGPIVNVRQSYGWQSFVPTVSGDLLQVSFDEFVVSGTNIGLLMKIYEGEGVGGALVGTHQQEGFEGVVDFQNPPTLIAGQLYTAEFTVTGQVNMVENQYIVENNPYPEGRSNIDANADYVFSTRMRDGDASNVSITSRGRLHVGGPSEPTLARLHVGSGIDFPLFGIGVLDGEGILLDQFEAVLGLYSETGSSGSSALIFGEVDSDTTSLVDKWAFSRDTSSDGSALRVRYGTNHRHDLNPAHLTVTASGNMGIGAVDPIARLSVLGETNAQTVRFSGPEGNYRFLQDLNSSNQASWTFRNGATGTPAMVIVADGRIGMGVTSIDGTLHVRGDSPGRVAKFDLFGGDGQIVAFARDDQIKGSITVSGETVSYNAFTGSHYGWCERAPEVGALVSMTGDNVVPVDGGEPLYGVAVSTVANDPACLGAYLDTISPAETLFDRDIRLIAAVGNGELWVAANGRDIRPGDALISSDVAGCAMLDDPERFPVGYVVARAAEGVRWADVAPDERGVRRAKISVLFGAFVRGGADTRGEIQALRLENEALRARLGELERLVREVVKETPSAGSGP